MPDYLCQLRPMPGDGRPDEIRLRKGLKLLKRACGIEVVELMETDRCPLPAPRPPKRKNRKNALPETK